MTLNPQELKGLIDSTPDKSVLLNLAGFYAKRQLPEKGVDSEVVYDCPQIGAHFHTVSDEVVIVVGGRGELLINGEWKPVKQGDVHVCPRGIIHDTRAPAENLQYISIFTPHLPPGTDINWVK